MISEDHEVSEDEIVGVIEHSIGDVKKTRTHYKISCDAIVEYLPSGLDEDGVDDWILEVISSYAAKSSREK